MKDVRNSPDPRITDLNDPRYTALGVVYNRIDLTMLMSDDAYFQNGYVIYDVVKRFEEVKLNVGDFACIENRFGFVNNVLRGGDGLLLGVQILEYLPYNVLSAESDPEAYYGEGSNKLGRMVTYLFRDPGGEDLNVEGVPLYNGGGVPQYNVFRGSMKILHKVTSDKNTWNAIQQASDRYNKKQV